jgi:hypothetical protein
VAKRFDSPAMPPVKPLQGPPDSRLIPLDRQTPLTHQQIEQVRFGIGDTGPLAQAVMNSNPVAFTQALPFGVLNQSGMIMLFADDDTWTAPEGWVQCDGRYLERSEYPRLFAVLGTKFGSTASTNFRVPTLSDPTTNVKYVVKA